MWAVERAPALPLALASIHSKMHISRAIPTPLISPRQPHTRAARAVVELGMKVREITELEQRLANLEEQMAATTEAKK